MCVLRSGTAVQTRVLRSLRRNLQRSMRRCAVKLLFWHSPRYACTHPGRTILPCVLDGQTTDAFLFSPALDALFFGLPRLCLAKSTQVCCALHTSAHTTRYACLNILSMIRGFCASPWPGHSVRGPCFIKTFFCAFCAQSMSFAPGHIERTPRPAWVAPSYGLCAHSLHGFVSRPSASCALLSSSSFVAAAHRCMKRLAPSPYSRGPRLPWSVWSAR